MQLVACKNHEDALYFIKNPTEAAQEYAVKTFPESIKYIKNPSEKIQK